MAGGSSPVNHPQHRTIAWQGWSLRLPRRWDPVKVEGDYAQGYVLFADALRPRVGIRWQSPRRKKRFDPAHAVEIALRREIGQLAFEESEPWTLPPWQSARSYSEPEPPGRDVFSAYSQTSDRLLQVVYHARRRENVFRSLILPTLGDQPVGRATFWSIFDLNCVVPGGMHLKTHRLHAGDIGLTFEDRGCELTVRQIAVGSLALARQNLDGWVRDQQNCHKRYHRPGQVFSGVESEDGSTARLSVAVRRRRYMLLRSQPPAFYTLARYSPAADRLVIIEATSEPLIAAIAPTVGGNAPPDQTLTDRNR